jgi:TonB family protein
MLPAWGTTQAASIPKEVLDVYKAYNQAYIEKDYAEALTLAKKAWKTSEKYMGASVTTGNLAYNYGSLARKMGKAKLAVPALIQSIELVDVEDKKAEIVRQEREVELVTIYLTLKEQKKAIKIVNAALDRAKNKRANETVFYGELLVYKSMHVHSRANNQAEKSININRSKNVSVAKTTERSSATYAEQALKIFNDNPDMTRPTFKALAHKLIGFSFERDKKWLDATLEYQKAMLIQKKLLKIDDPSYATTLGRWLNGRNYVQREAFSYRKTNRIVKRDGLKQYRSNRDDYLDSVGICRCWPYNKSDENVKRIAEVVERVAPRMPGNAWTSGFAIVKFDLLDDGTPTNINVIHSWPKKVYSKSSIKAIQRWKYSPRQQGETDEQRQGIVTTLHYYLRTERGDPI